MRRGKTMTMRCIAALAGLLLAACATATIEDAVPAGALPQTAPTPTESPAAPTAGSYPNICVEPPAAAAQITEAQKSAEMNDLRAKREQLARLSGRTGAATSDLSGIAASHGDAALKEIEGR